MSISKLHHITQDLPEISHQRQTGEACKGGTDWVQLRVKNRSFEEWLVIAREVQQICKEYNSKLIINDSVAIALEIGADGVHLGKKDMSPSEARSILGKGFIIGGTANTYEDIRSLAAQKVDYVGLGPFRFTKTKENLSPVLGLEGYKQIISKCQEDGIEIPVIAIGGIVVDDIMDIMNTGMYGIAVSSAINLAKDINLATDQFIQMLNVEEKQ